MRGRILIVEDELAIRNGLKARLEAGGFEVATANNGRDGVAAFGASPFDLVVMDVMMPVMDGFEACKAIREKDKATPIVFLSCLENDADRILALDLGAVEFVRKDDIDTPRMSMEYFMSLIDRHIRRVRELEGLGVGGYGLANGGRGERTFKVGEMEIPLGPLAEALCHVVAIGVEVDAVQLHLGLLLAIEVHALAIVDIDAESYPLVLPHGSVAIDGIVAGQLGHIALELNGVDPGIAILAVPQLHVGMDLSSDLARLETETQELNVAHAPQHGQHDGYLLRHTLDS